MSNSLFHISNFNCSLRSNYERKKQKGSDTPPFYSITDYCKSSKNLFYHPLNSMLRKVFFDISEEFV